jgi:histone acetyltransferase MYST1
MARPKKQKAESPAVVAAAATDDDETAATPTNTTAAATEITTTTTTNEEAQDTVSESMPVAEPKTTEQSEQVHVIPNSSSHSGKKQRSTSKATPGSTKMKPKLAAAAASATATSTLTTPETALTADPPRKKKGRPPKVDLGAIGATPSSSATDMETPKSATSQDQHPFARSSVIEVWHGVEDPSDDSWWTEDSESDTEDVITTKHHFKPQPGKQASIRLCDVIDRVPVGDGKWRYYVHYRDFNRRMDEWVSMERIVSPPSVGNAKARALKAEEEKQKKKEAKKEAMQQQVVDVLAPRASRRRSFDSGPGATTPVGERQTRKHRRRTMADDDATVVAGNQQNSDRKDEDETPMTIAETGIVALPTEAVHTTAIGEHVVETIAAQELDEHEGLDEASLREHEEVTKVKNVAFIELGAFQMETWYFSPLPKELLSEGGLIEVLYVCEFTLNMFSRKSELRRFQSRLPVHARHPPGNEIYRNGNLAMFEVDGFEERIYCQNLCYIAKLFLDHKTLYFDVDPFLFYVLCEVDSRGFHPVGYYSKEKYSDVGYNLACILTFPCHQRKGYGRFLIAFSYELSKKEEKVGSPEKPMSDLGQQAYKPYWASTIVDFFLNQAPETSTMSIMEISKVTSIMAEDIVFTLNQLGILKIINGVYFIAAEKGLLLTLAKKYPVKEPRVAPSNLHWSPFLTDVKRDKFSIHSKKPSVEGDEMRGSGGFP